MIVIGIDPGKYGYDAAMIRIDADGNEELKVGRFSSESKEYQLPSQIVFKTRVAVEQLMYAAMVLWPLEEEIVVFCEEAVSAGARNLRTYGQMAMSVGAILAGVTSCTPRCYLVPVSTWKRGTCGSGNASKEQVALWLNRVLPNYAAECGGRQDLIDACCIARYGLTIVAQSLLVGADHGPGEV